MQVSEQNPNDNGNSEGFAERYVKHMVDRLFTTGHWGVADVLFRECPKEHLNEVALRFLDDHFTLSPFAKRGDFH